MTTRRLVSTAALALALLAVPASALGQACDGRTELRLDQETYAGLTDRVYVYAPDINSGGSRGGWQGFTLRILSGMYRRPLLLPRAFLKESDLGAALRSRSDVRETPLAVPGFTPGQRPPQYAPITVRDGERAASLTIRVTRVVPVSGGTDHLFLACSIAP